ncbi:hypothetical protein N7454_003234 [Penicillium verhagenii]|nr:hypothetical protein N7454_003234 [Penicillium verhagenii]
MSSQEPAGRTDHCLQGREDSFTYDGSVSYLIEKLLHQEQQSINYQAQLESRIYSDFDATTRLAARCQQLERFIIGVQHQKSHVESTLCYTTEAYRVALRELEKEKSKVQLLEARVNQVHPEIQFLLDRLRRDESNRRWLNDKETHDDSLLQSQYQVMHEQQFATPEDGDEEPEDGVEEPEDGVEEPEDGVEEPEDGVEELGGEPNDISSDGSCEIFT